MEKTSLPSPNPSKEIDDALEKGILLTGPLVFQRISLFDQSIENLLRNAERFAAKETLNFVAA